MLAVPEFSQTRQDSPGQCPADTKAEKGPTPEANEREQQVPLTAAMDRTTQPAPPASLAALRVETG